MKWQIAIVLLFTVFAAYPQALDSAKIATMTREEIMALSQDDLLELSMENLVFLAGKMGISIDELLNMKTNVASKTTLTPRETPGIISVITSDEIRKSGARDMIDVLRLVPGFDFGYDVQGVIGAGIRGNWVHEGKMLFMIDGLPLNELSYANVPFGNHMPVDQIKRIEIIRGPGSVIYGGAAELGVINIITFTGKDHEGVEVSRTYGQMKDAMGRDNISIKTGFVVKNWDISAYEFIGKANRSDQSFKEYIDSPDEVLDLSSHGNSAINTHQFNLAANNEKLFFRMVYDDYKSRYNYFEDSVAGTIGATNEFRNIFGEVKYKQKLNDKLTLTPAFKYKYSRPYYEEDYWRNFRINRYVGNLVLQYQPLKNATVVAGLEYTSDNGYCLEDSGIFLSNEKRGIYLNNVAAFAEGLVKAGKVNMIAGYRVEKNSSYGWASAPRIGLTGIFGKFHFKTLFSGAFRSPSIGNIDVSIGLKPEKSWVTEVEVGYRLNDNMFITANFFDIYIDRSIVYFDNGGWTTGIDYGYENASSSGSDGFEVEYKAIYAKGSFTANYSFHTQAFRSMPDLYAVPGEEYHSLGLARNKLAFYGTRKLTNNVSISPSLIVYGKKYAYLSIDEEGNPLASAMSPDYLLNLSANWDNLFKKGLGFSVSVYDILNEKPSFIQAYNGGLYPYPGRSREFVFRLTISSDILN